MGGIDDLFRQMREDDLADKVETTTHATPIEYARTRGIAPQKVYYALRKHRDKLNTEQCKCGRRVLDITMADIYFGFKDELQDAEDIGNGNTEGSIQDTEDDEPDEN